MGKHYIIYKTTNLLNRRYYIGMHVTSNIDDGYLGSGRRIKAEIKKYGRENFSRVVLEELFSKEALAQREAELVTEELRADPLCLNLKNGGEGGWDHVKNQSIAGRARAKAFWSNPKNVAAHAARSSARLKRMHPAGQINYNTFSGKTHTAETKAKIGEANSVHQTGSGNSQFGTCWVTNGAKPFKIKKEELDKYLTNGYRRGRK